MADTNPLWRRRMLESLRRSNKVDLSGENIDDLSKLGTLKLMHSLDLSYVQISTLEGMPNQPNLKIFILDGTAISSFKNFSAVNNITSISLKRTPVLKEPNYLVSLLLVCPKVTIVNGKLISEKTKSKVESYPSFAHELVNAGWMAEYPCPPDDVLNNLKKQYKILSDEYEEVLEEEEEEEEGFEENEIKNENEANQKEVKSPTLSTPKKVKSQTLSPSSNKLDKSKKSPKKTPEKNKPKADELEKSLVEKVADVLRKNGIDIDSTNLQQSVLNAIDALCAEREQQKRFAELLTSDQSSDAALLQNNESDGPDVTIDL